ncbi:MAG: ABC transporter permease [Dehalococcoidia bacterium]|nr:MAG: ABC transporter permease [Dehalococcoidia bacterium]
MKFRLPQKIAGADSVAVVGSVLGLSALLAGWFTLKANRLVQGDNFNIVGASGWSGALLLLALWLGCMGLSLRSRGRQRSYLALGIIANVIFVVIAFLTVFSASNLLDGTGASARVSMGGGVWLSLLAVYFIIFTSYRGLSGMRWRQLGVMLPGVAIFTVMLFTGAFDQLSVMREYITHQERFAQELGQHLFLVGASVIAAGSFGIALGIWAARRRKAEKYIFAVTNITQTIPSLALFGLMIAPLAFLSFQFPFLRELGIRGIGATPAIIALFIYALLPIVRNTFIGLRQIDRGVLDAGSGMGMSRGQLFRRIEVPLAAPLVLEGLHIASVQAVGLAAVAALIGAGGLGWFIFQGLGQAAPDMILLGTIPIIFMAVIVDSLMRLVVSLGSPRGLKRSN